MKLRAFLKAILASIAVLFAAPFRAKAQKPWRIYQMNDYDCYVARSLEEAIECVKETNCTDHDWLEFYLDGPHELRDAALDKKMFHDEQWLYYGDKRPEFRRSFRAELDRMIAAGLDKPRMFSTTEI